MSKIRMLKSLVSGRLIAAAEEIFGLFEVTFEGYEGEVLRAEQQIHRQQERLDLLLKPEIKLCRLLADPPHLSPSLGQEEPEPLQIKEEQEELWTSQEGEQLQGLEEADIIKFTFNPVSVKREHDGENTQSSQFSQTPGRESLQIKEEHGELFQQQEEEAASSRFTPQPIKCENEEDNTQWSQLSQTFKEESGEGDPLPSTSTDQMNTECDGQLFSSHWSETEMEHSDDYRKVNERLDTAAKEICGIIRRTVKEYQEDIFHAMQEISHQRHLLDLVLNPDKELCRAAHLQLPICEEEVRPSDMEPGRDGQPLSSESSDAETDDRDDCSKETREPQPGLNSTKKTQKGQSSSPSQTIGRSCCKVCGGSFANIVSLMRHVRVHSKTCGFCEKRLEPTESLASHLQVHRKCDVCGKRFSSDKTLGEHLRVHTGEKPFMCVECNKVFMTKSHLGTHMKSHMGERPLKCSVCFKGIGRKSDLVIHMRVHTGEKPFSCSICNEGFWKMSDLRMHMSVHTAEKHFNCHVCNKAFKIESHLRIHRSIHKMKPFKCSVWDIDGVLICPLDHNYSLGTWLMKLA